MAFPPDSILSWLLLGVFSLILLYLYLLPKRIHDKAIVKLENKLDKELDLLSIIRSQVEPRKIDTYLVLSDIYSEIASKQAAALQGLPPTDELKEAEKQRSALQTLSRLFLFASDKTIQKFLDFKRKNNPLQSFDLYADFIVSMRKDLHEDTNLQPQDFIDVVILHTPKTSQPDKK